MKEVKKIIVMIAITCIILCCSPIVNAESSTQITISEGIKDGNAIIFTVTLPNGAGFRGDATGDGVVDSVDSSIILNYVSMIIDETKLNMLNSDFNLDGTVNSVDNSELNIALLDGYKTIDLTGTLAQEQGISYSISKNINGTYKVSVQLPEGKQGTIGIRVSEEKVIFTDRTVNKSVIESNLYNVSNQQQNVDKNITISNGVKESNKVTFNINLPSNVGLRGDANDDGKLTSEDATLIENYVAMKIDASKLNMLNSDVNLDGKVDISDVVAFNMELLDNYSVITLNGSLANKSTYELIKDQNGKYSVVVTVPDNDTGTIGITLNKKAVVFEDHTSNEGKSSNLLEISNSQGNNSKDNTTANTELPKAGYKTTIVFVIVIVSILGILGYVRYKNIDK